MSLSRVFAAIFLLHPVSLRAEALPAFSLDPDAVTVSGLSSGGAMAVQLHVAFSDHVAGAGVVAGAPYGCAEASASIAVGFCMGMTEGAVGRQVRASLARIRALAEDGLIADPGGLAGDALYLFHGEADETVSKPAMDTVRDVYAALRVETMTYVSWVGAGHGFLTDEGAPADRTPCAQTEPPFLNLCPAPPPAAGFRDQAAEILRTLYGSLQPETTPLDASFLAFDQSLYAQGAPGMDEVGYLYAPAACRTGGETCRLHIALHGCRQGRWTLGEGYARGTGYNGWAEANRIVVLYPQAKPTEATLGDRDYNPNGCWDWWGYSQEGFGDDYLTRAAPQMAAIARMAAALGAPLE